MKDRKALKTAKLEFLEFYCDWIVKHNLTIGEITKILADQIASDSDYMIRVEATKRNKG